MTMAYALLFLAYVCLLTSHFKTVLKKWIVNVIRWTCLELGCSTWSTTEESEGNLSCHQVLTKHGSHRHQELVD